MDNLSLHIANNIFAYLAMVLALILLILGATLAYARFSFRDLLNQQGLFDQRLDLERDITHEAFPPYPSVVQDSTRASEGRGLSVRMDDGGPHYQSGK